MTSDRPPHQVAAGLATALADRYRIEGQLGAGGMATVYLAEDVRHGRKVAIKILRPELAAVLGTERFLSEIHISARLDHPHILTLIDSGEAAGVLWYVIPYIRGESLRDLLIREKQLALEQALTITRQVGSALDYAHRQGVVHRDIKPENILLHEGEAMLADFGIALAVKEAAGERLTETGFSLGTPQYMSPEQATGERELDARSDVYSLAAVLYEMLAGEPPHSGATAQIVIAKLLVERPIRLRTIRDSIPEQVDNAVARGLAKVPADRFPSVDRFVAAITVPSTASVPLAAAVPSSITPSRFSLRGRLLIWGLVIAMVALGAWISRALWNGDSQAMRGGSTEPDPNRVAVLYFRVPIPDHALAALADGLTEALIHQLSDVTALQVISSNGVASFRQTNAPLDSIARALNVGTIVTGKMDSFGDSLQVTVTLVDVTSGREVGHRAVRVPRANILALQDSLAGQVSVFLRQRLGQELQRLAVRAGTRSDAAWELVREADLVQREADTLVAKGDTAGAARFLLRSDSLLARAARLDRRWVEPVVRRGWVAAATRRITGFDKRAATEWIGRAMGFAQDALELAPDDPEAHRLRGSLRYYTWVLNLDAHPMTPDQLLAAAELDLRAGTASGNPRRAEAWLLLSHLLLRKSQATEGKLAALRAYEADPYLSDASGVLSRLFSSSLDLEDAAESARWCAEGYRRFPSDPVFTECQITLFSMGASAADVQRAWQLLEQNIALYPPAARELRRRRGQLLVAMAIARAGFKDSAHAVALRARTDDPAIDPTRDLVYVEFLLRNLMADRDAALERLALYLATNPQDRATVARDQTWWLRGIRDDPRFKDLVREGR